MTQAIRNTTTSDRLTTVLSYGALLLLGYLVFRIVEPFVEPLAWSAVLAIFFYPVYARLLRKTSPTWAAVYCTVGVTLLLIVPVLLVLVYAAREAVVASAQVQAAISSGSVGMPAHLTDWIRARLPETLRSVDFVGLLQQGAERVGSYLATSVGSWLRNLFSFFVNLFILLFALFFMFRDGQQIVHALRHLIPFDAEIQKDMLEESRDLIFASVAVALLIAAIQGVLGGTAFALTGLGAPVFMGVLIAFFSIVPVVGSALIWVPAALWLGINGHWGKALLLVAICGGVAGVADNLVRPLLMRNRTRLNDLLLFISILGGLDVFGLLGLVAGPTILAAALGVLRVYMEHRDKLEKESA
ncbi:MAG TPA: AI-2E family transporter [Candidatus Dormibacteraeota bacterium]|nr:AI-2E family transporter [Candidatus Dormibacteraeota bacterium]